MGLFEIPPATEISKIYQDQAFPPPLSYGDFCSRFAALQTPRSELNGAEFVLSAASLLELKKQTGPGYLPFFHQPQPHHTDVYAFTASGGVVVFAMHATVAQWPSLWEWVTFFESLGCVFQPRC